jgi:hypothetical protein
LDFEGDFIYAINFNGDASHATSAIVGDTSLIIGDAVFTSDASTPGLTISQNTTAATGIATGVHFGPSLDDTNLVLILTTIRYYETGFSNYDDLLESPTGDRHGKSIIIQLEALHEQSIYSLQLLFNCEDPVWAVCFDVLVDDVLIAAQFDQATIQGSAYSHVSAAFIRYSFTAYANTMTITLKTSDTGCPVGDPDPTVQALTLELITKPELYSGASLGSALRLVDDAYIQLPGAPLGGSVAISAWICVGTLWDGNQGITLFNSFQGTACGDSDACRNAVGDTLDRHGWLAVGNDVAARRPADLWAAGVVFDRGTATLFWEGARDKWLMVTFVVSGSSMSVYANGQLWGIGALEAPLPRMLRQNNYVGAAHTAPFQPKPGGVSLAVADFRLYDRSLAAAEVVALFVDPSGKHTACCVAAGIRSPFGVGDLDLTPQLIGVVATGKPAAATVSSRAPGSGGTSSIGGSEECGSSQLQTARAVDICGDFPVVSDCQGTVSDGIGPYTASADCRVHLEGSPGLRYTLTFEEFDTEAEVDFLYVYAGASTDSPLLGTFTGKELPPSLTSAGPDLYLRFTSNDNGQATGFRAAFACSGTPLQYWKPATVATELPLGVLMEPTTLRSQQTACLSDVLLSVQCCTNTELSCANARVTSIGLSKHQLRGSLPEELGSLGALRSLKLHDNFLIGTFPSSLGKLHWLQELQLSHNQFAMQARTDLSKMLGGMMQLQTLDLGMSNEVQDLGRSIILPAPPLACRVGEPCGFTLSTRTAAALPLPHGGLQMRVRKADGGSDALCTDQMDGRYDCQLPLSWTTMEGDFDFTVSSDGHNFVPIRTLMDPTTGVVSTQDAYQRLAVTVAPIECTAAHAHPDGEGSQCVCEGGYYRRGTSSGGYSCEHCDPGQEPVDGGARCSLCVPGKYSTTGKGCVICSPGNEPNRQLGADSCTPCGGQSVSEYGGQCAKCEADQVADPFRTACVCPT